MAELAAAQEPGDLNRRGFRLYEQFRPEVPRGESGWGGLRLPPFFLLTGPSHVCDRSPLAFKGSGRD